MDYSRHDIYTCNHVGFRKFPLLISGANISTFWRFAGFSQKHLKSKSRNIVTGGKRRYFASKKGYIQNGFMDVIQSID